MRHHQEKYWFDYEINKTRHAFASITTIAVIVVLAIVCSLSSCKTCQPVVEIRDSVHVEYKLDSVYVLQHDSIFRDRWRNGDTVYVNVERWAIRYKDKIVMQHDTIRTQEKVVQNVEVVPAYYKRCSWALWIIVALVVIGVVARVLIKIYLHK